MDCDNVCPLDGHFFGAFSLLDPLDFPESSRRQNLLYWALWGLGATLKNLPMKTIDLLKSDFRNQLGASPLGSQPDPRTANSQTMWLKGDIFVFMIFFLYKNPSFIGRLSFLYISWCLGKWIVYLGAYSSYTDPSLWAYPLPCPTLDLQELINKVISSQWQSWCVPATILCTSRTVLHLVLTTSHKLIWQVQWKWSLSHSVVSNSLSPHGL